MISQRLQPSLVTVVLASWAAGCATGPDYQAPESPTAHAWRWDQHAPQGQESDTLPSDWWRLFNDPVLDALEQRALSENPGLRQAMERVVEARASTRSTGSALAPSVTLGPSYDTARNSANNRQVSQFGGGPGGNIDLTQSQFRMPLDVSYEIDLWGRVRRAMESATALEQANLAAYQTILLTLTADVAVNYFELRALDREIDTLHQTVALRLRSLELTQQRFGAGLARQADRARAETEWANAQADVLDAQRRRARLEHALAALCGESATTFFIEPGSSAAAPPEIPAGLPSELLLRRPDVVEAERRLASESAAIGIAKAEAFPSIRLTGVAGLESVELQDLFTSGSRFWTIGPNVSFPLFTGGRIRADVEAAESRYRQALEKYREQTLAAFREVENTLADLRHYQLQHDHRVQARTAAERTYHLADQRHAGGLSTYLDVVDAQRTLLQAERAQIQNDANRQAATIHLIKALGGGWQVSGPEKFAATTILPNQTKTTH